jgi:glycine dehydrogenase
MTNATPVRPPATETQPLSPFVGRHIGPRQNEVEEMLQILGCSSLEELMASVVPASLLDNEGAKLPPALTEAECLAELQRMASANSPWRSFLGLGYQAPVTPTVILRNVLENPGWYTQYTPYQAEISQGRLEALLNFQTMVCDLTGLPVANASLLDEGTAAAEAMTMALRSAKGKLDKPSLLLDAALHPQTIAVVCGRAEPLGIEVEVRNLDGVQDFQAGVFGIMVAYPGTDGEVYDWSAVAERANAADKCVIMVCDLLSLVALKSPALDGGAYLRRLDPALRLSPGLRRTARCLSGRSGPLQANLAGPHRRDKQRPPGPTGFAPGPANPRAAHPPR